MPQELPEDQNTLSPEEAKLHWEEVVKDIYKKRQILSGVLKTQSKEDQLWDFATDFQDRVSAASQLSSDQLEKYAAYHSAVGSGPIYDITPDLDLPDNLITRTFDEIYKQEMSKLKGESE